MNTKPLSDGTLPDTARDLLIAEFGREVPDLTDDPIRREGLYLKPKSGIYYLVDWTPDEHLAVMLRAGRPPRSNPDITEQTPKEARQWLDDRIAQTLDYMDRKSC